MDCFILLEFLGLSTTTWLWIIGIGFVLLTWFYGGRGGKMLIIFLAVFGIVYLLYKKDIISSEAASWSAGIWFFVGGWALKRSWGSSSSGSSSSGSSSYSGSSSSSSSRKSADSSKSGLPSVVLYRIKEMESRIEDLKRGIESHQREIEALRRDIQVNRGNKHHCDYQRDVIATRQNEIKRMREQIADFKHRIQEEKRFYNKN